MAYPPSEVCITELAVSILFPPYVRVHAEEASTETAQLQINKTTRTLLKRSGLQCNIIPLDALWVVLAKKVFCQEILTDETELGQEFLTNSQNSGVIFFVTHEFGSKFPKMVQFCEQPFLTRRQRRSVLPHINRFKPC